MSQKVNQQDHQDDNNKHSVLHNRACLWNDVNKLGCVMIDLKPFSPELLTEATIELQDDFYYAENDEHFWINGFTLGNNPHLTLLYGLLQPAYEIKQQVDAVLQNWTISQVEVTAITYFESQLPDEDCYCLVAKVRVNDNLKEGRSRLQLLPHIDTFAEYIPHITIGYIKKDKDVVGKAATFFAKKMSYQTFDVDKINYGENKSV